MHLKLVAAVCETELEEKETDSLRRRAIPCWTPVRLFYSTKQ